MKHSTIRTRVNTRRARALLNRARGAARNPVYRAQAVFLSASAVIAVALFATPMGRSILTAATDAEQPLRTVIFAGIGVLCGAAFVAITTITLHHLSQISTEARYPAR